MPEAVRRRQPGPLADQHRDRRRAERLADVVAQRDARLLARSRPAPSGSRLAQRRHQRGRAAPARARCTPVAESPSATTKRDAAGAARGQRARDPRRAAGARDRGAAGRCGGPAPALAHAEHRQAERRERRRQRRHVERRPHRVARPRMRSWKSRCAAVGSAVAGAAERRRAPSVKRRRSRQQARASRHASPISAGDSARRHALARRSPMPMRSSQASNSGAGALAQRGARVEPVMEGGGLVGQHHVVRARHAHHIGHAGDAEQRQQRVHVVLVGLGVVGVADVDAHRQAEQLAAEMVLEPGADDLLAVVEVFGADEADDGVDQQRREVARDGIGARLDGLLVARRDAPRPTARCPGRSRNT